MINHSTSLSIGGCPNLDHRPGTGSNPQRVLSGFFRRNSPDHSERRPDGRGYVLFALIWLRYVSKIRWIPE
jgi:hypothetical protein